MYLHNIVHLCGVMLLTAGNLPDHSHCFKTVSRLIPDADGNIATLTFSVLNTCLEGESDLKSVKVFRGSVHQLPKPICLVKYNHGNCQKALGCTCHTRAQTVTMEKHVDTLEHDVWILEVELTNGVVFNKTVVFNVEGVHTETNYLVMVIAISAGAAVLVTIILFVCVCCRRRNARASRTSLQSTRGCPGRPLPLQPPSPRAQDTGSQQVKPDQSKRHVRPRSAHSYVDMDNDYIEARADALKAAFDPRADIKGDDYLHPVSSAADQHRWHRHHADRRGSQPRSLICDDDGYLLADPPSSHGREGRDAKPSYANSTV